MQLQELDNITKLALGLHLREAGPRWDTVYILSIAQDYFQQHYSQIPVDQTIIVPSKFTYLLYYTSECDVKEEFIVELIRKYGHLNEIIDRSRLTNIHNVKPLLDGTQICELYQMKPGKALKFLMEEEIKFQILHPEADYARVEEHLLTNKEELLKKYS